MEFDWRHYIRVDGPGERDAQSGELRLSDQYAAFIERSPDLKPQITELLKQQEIIEAELDFAARLPGFQEDLIRGASLAHDRLDDAKRILGAEPRDDARLVLEIGSSGNKTVFHPYDNSIVVSPHRLVGIDYIGVDGQQHPFTLLQVLVHEIGHFGDPKFSAEFEFSMRGEAFEGGIARLLADFPEYAEDYKHSKTIAGLDFGQIEQAENFDIFDKALEATLGFNNIRAFPSDGETLRAAYERKFENSSGHDYSQEIIQQYFRTVYNEEFSAIDEQEMEYPIIDRTYDILSEVYPDLVKRAEYEAVKNNNLEDIGPFDDGYHERVTELLKDRSVAVSEGNAVDASPDAAPALDVAPPIKP